MKGFNLVCRQCIGKSIAKVEGACLCKGAGKDKCTVCNGKGTVNK